MRAVITACRDGSLAAEAAVIIGNNSAATALHWSRDQGLPTYHLSGRTHPDPGTLDGTILAALKRHDVDLVCLAGYMKRLGPRTLKAYGDRILNIHPALLPKYGGRGFYGAAVHQAVIKAGEKESGATVHLVDEQYDQGRILAQEKVPVQPDDTPQSLAARVLQAEHRLYPATLRRITSGAIPLAGLDR
jgi:phosphoribosylglycinamide formyltransferase 1